MDRYPNTDLRYAHVDEHANCGKYRCGLRLNTAPSARGSKADGQPRAKGLPSARPTITEPRQRSRPFSSGEDCYSHSSTYTVLSFGEPPTGHNTDTHELLSALVPSSSIVHLSSLDTRSPVYRRPSAPHTPRGAQPSPILLYPNPRIRHILCRSHAVRHRIRNLLS